MHINLIYLLKVRFTIKHKIRCSDYVLSHLLVSYLNLISLSDDYYWQEFLIIINKNLFILFMFVFIMVKYHNHIEF